MASENLLDATILACWETAEEHGFHSVERTYGDACALITSEVSESFEAFREKGRHYTYYEVDGKPEGSLAELADVVIRCFDVAIGDIILATEPNMHPENAALMFASILHMKMAYNVGRPHMHGKSM